MKQLFDQVSFQTSKLVTEKYSTSFSMAVKMLSPSIRSAIYNIYGFVRFADEIVDTFHNYKKEQLLENFEKQYYMAVKNGISLNPILNSFQATVTKYNIPDELVVAFLNSMKADLFKTTYKTKKEYEEYIYGSADVVGLMCLKVFVSGDEETYKKLKPSAMALGSAFQKVNFLRDLNADFHDLNRTYFPNLDFKDFDDQSKMLIMEDIENDFRKALKGIYELPNNSKFGVYAAYKYYRRLLVKLKRTSYMKIKNERVRVPNYQKVDVLARSYIRYRLNIL